jgi:hypothetical protein
MPHYTALVTVLAIALYVWTGLAVAKVWRMMHGG